MLCLKKVYKDEVFKLAFILGLLRINTDSYIEPDILDDGGFDIDNGTSWRSFSSSIIRPHFVHPKNLDSVLINYERELFADLNALGRYNRNYRDSSSVATYLLNVERNNPSTTASSPIITNSENQTTSQLEDNAHAIADNNLPLDLGVELTQEDMDLIEVLWKQDVDLGFTLEPEIEPEVTLDTKSLNATPEHDKIAKKEPEDPPEKEEKEAVEDDPWKGFNYTIDIETGEYVVKEEEEDATASNWDYTDRPQLLDDLPLPLNEFLLDEALGLVDLNEDKFEDDIVAKDEEASIAQLAAASEEQSVFSDASSSKSGIDDLFPDMIQTSQFHHRPFQGRMPFVRTMSMEQRWQDLANLLSFPGPTDGSSMHHPFSHHHALHNYSHSHPHHGMSYGPETRGVLLHNATLTPPVGDVNSSVPFGNLGGTNLGNAVATSMNLTNNTEPMGESGAGHHYKLEPHSDMIYYQNTSAETDGFLSSILNEEDLNPSLNLMDIAVNEGMYPMRMLDSNITVNGLNNSNVGLNSSTVLSKSEIERIDTSSDSAVSSMGSERVPSISDGEWCDIGSDSGHTAGDHYANDYHLKYRPYEYNSYSSRQQGPDNLESSRMPPVAQKKHQMFGKRYFQEQSTSANVVRSSQNLVKYEYKEPTQPTAYASPARPEGAIGHHFSELKYSCSLEFSHQNPLTRTNLDHIHHNHTYHLPPEGAVVLQRPMARDKAKKKSEAEEHLTRDEKRARALNIPITVDDIINLPMDEFNERLSKFDLSEAQLSLIRDIRRRGKNKVAAQNCRKRKLDQINSLADEVKEMRDRKIRLINEYDYHKHELKRIRDKYQQFYQHVFQTLRDPEGNPYSSYHYSLQTAPDGSIHILPRTNSSVEPPERKDHLQDHKNG